jgi:hypothetical protein
MLSRPLGLRRTEVRLNCCYVGGSVADADKLPQESVFVVCYTYKLAIQLNIEQFEKTVLSMIII